MSIGPYQGAVGRTINDIAGDFPTPMTFGALGDGVTDDTAAFEAAFAASSSTSGTDVLHIPANRVFIVSGLTILRNGFRIVGSQGQDPVSNLGRIKLKNGANASVLTVSGANCRVEGFNVDGNQAGQTVATPAILLAGSGAILESTLVQNSKGDGIKIAGCDSVRVVSVTCSGNAGYGLNLASVTNALINDSNFTGNGTGSFTTSGVNTFKCNGNNGLTDRSDYQILTAGNLAEIPNDTSIGTIINRFTINIGGKARVAPTTATGGIMGVCQGNAGTSLSCDVAIFGPRITVDFDGATTAGNYVVPSTTTAGKAHDSGVAAGGSLPTGTQVMGIVLSTNGVAGTYIIFLFPPEIRVSSGGGGGMSAAPPYLYDGSNYYISSPGLVQITRPSLTSFTYNGAVGSVGANGNVVMTIASGNNTMNAGYVSAPATPYTFTAVMQIDPFDISGTASGIWRGGGLFLALLNFAETEGNIVGFGFPNAYFNFGFGWHSPGGSFEDISTTPTDLFFGKDGQPFSPSDVLYLQIHNDGTNLSFRLSGNGQPNSYIEWFTVPISTYFTTGAPTLIGWYGSEGNTLLPSVVTLLSWLVS